MANIRKTFNFREGVKVDDSVLVVAGARVGIGSTIPTKTLDVKGDAIFTGQVSSSTLIVSGVSTFSDVGIGTEISIESSSGIITASKFYGDASTLSNIPTSQWTDMDVGLGFTSIYNSGNVGVGTTDPRFTMQIGSDPRTVGKEGVGIDGVNGNIQSSGIITATSFVGNGSSITSLNGSNINSGTIAAARVATLNQDTTGTAALAEGLTGTPDVTVNDIASRHVNSSGVITATSFVGDLTGNADTATIASGLSTTVDYTVNNLITGIGSFGSIGIGTTQPVSDIQILKSGNSVITLGRGGSATGNNGAISFGKETVGFPYSNANSLDIINYGIGNVNFYLEGGSVGVTTGDFFWHRRGNYSRLMTLTNGGRLGIGVTQPINDLHVVGTSTVTSNAFFGNDVNIKGDVDITGGLTVGSFSVSTLSADVTGNLTGNVNAASGLSTFTNAKITSGLGIGTDAPTTGLALNSGTSRVSVNINGSIGIKTTDTYFSGINALNANTIVGSVGAGTTILKSSIDFSDAGKVGIITTNRFMIPPKLTAVERSAIAAVQEGAFVYNTDNNRLEVYNGSTWVGVSSDVSSSGISNVVEDTSPELGGNLDINGKFINGTGGANITGVITATTFSGSGASLTGLTGAGASTYGATNISPVITVDANGRITGITTASITDTGISNVVDDTSPQLGGNLDINGKYITGTGGANITGVVTATTFSGSGASLTGLTGAGASTYGSSTISPVITVDGNGRITGITTAFSGISDGDKGHIVVSNSGNTWNIDDNVVTDQQLNDTGVSAGSYTNANITVDAQGRLSSASSGSGGSGSNLGITTGLTGSFTASAGVATTINTYTYNSTDLVFEYTVFVKNGSDYQSQKLLVMRDGTTPTSTQYGIMYNNSLLVQLDATISGGDVSLRATPETGITGITTYRLRREVT